MKFVLVTGGVMSGIGKGIVASSTGVLLQAMGFRVTAIKIDPYLNVDAGTMSPFEHGEVFVTDDGGEGDLDLGNYERFLDLSLTRDNNLTTGKVYQSVIERERRGEYLGKTVQVVPHIVDFIQQWVERVARVPTQRLESTSTDRTPEVCVIELGGTVGDIESAPYVEAFRQFQFRHTRGTLVSIHVSLVPITTGGEQKTKPTQASVRELRALGIAPDVVVCRSAEPLTADTKKKIEYFCQVPANAAIGCHDVHNTYAVPGLLASQGLHTLLMDRLQLKPREPQPRLTAWQNLAARWDHIMPPQGEPAKPLVTIALVGKYTGLQDAYLSVHRALQHAALHATAAMRVTWIESTHLEPSATAAERDAAWAQLRAASALLVPGGFGTRGIEGIITAITHARTKRVPYLGICLGLQLAVVEYARNVLGWAGATSEEFRSADSPQGRPVVIFMPEGSRTHLGGTMRLGARQTRFVSLDSHLARLYQLTAERPIISERHRHRYEVDPAVVPELERAGIRFVARDVDTGQRMECVELPADEHPYFVAVQFHPEFKSRPFAGSAPFLGLLLAAAGKYQQFQQPHDLSLSSNGSAEETVVE